MKGRAEPGHTAAEHTVGDMDLDTQVQEYSKLYSINQWLQPRSMVQVQLAKLKEETRCPMCFGKIRDARISMVCLHRYCAKCIEQYLRAKVPGRHGDDKECPVCRAHLHSRRAAKPDPKFDTIIKALYGDVDKFDAEEEALIEADNKAHVMAWQAQLADMKARQAAAVAAAKAEGPQSKSSAAAAQERRLAAAAASAGMARPASNAQLDYMGAADGGWDMGGGGSGGRSSKKRSWAAAVQNGDAGGEEDEVDGRTGKGSTKVARLAGASSSRAGGGAGSGSGSRKSAFAAAAAAAAGGADDGGDDGELLGRKSDGLRAMGSGGAGVPKKKKRSSMTVARMIGLAAQAAAAAGPPPCCCVVQLVPHTEQQQQQQQQQDGEATSSAAAEAAGAAGRPEGRSRKQSKPSSKAGKGAAEAERQPLQQLLPGQVAAPTIDRPFLACPVGLTVAGLKKLLLQQLQQQGTTADTQGTYEVELVLGQQQGLLAAVSGSNGSSGALLGDDLTVAQLQEQGGCLGPGVQVEYRLVGV